MEQVNTESATARAIRDHFAQQTARPENPRQVVRELIALVHALTGGDIPLPRNPYTLDAIRKGNLWLTGDALNCGFSESVAVRMLADNKGRAPVTGDL